MNRNKVRLSSTLAAAAMLLGGTGCSLATRGNSDTAPVTDPTSARVGGSGTTSGGLSTGGTGAATMSGPGNVGGSIGSGSGSTSGTGSSAGAAGAGITTPGGGGR